MENVKGYLPLFHGFYCTMHEIDEERILDSVNYYRAENGKEEIHYGWQYDNIEIDIKKYMSDYGKSAIDNYKEFLSPVYVSNIIFESIYSPREYNFSTDLVNVEYEITEENKKNILDFVLSHLEEFKQYIKDTFSDRSGFFSLYSNNFNYWLNCLKKWEFKNIETQFSIFLEFILLTEYSGEEINTDIRESFISDNDESEYCTNFDHLVNMEIKEKEV